MGQTLRIKELYSIERPREKLINYGTSRLADEELLAILLRTGRKGKNAIELAKDILIQLRNNEFSTSSDNAKIISFGKIKGIGIAKACEIIACLELGKRFNSNLKHRAVITPEDMWNESSDIHNAKREHLVIFLLDTRFNLIKKEIISVGTLNENLVHPREVFEPAIKNSAASIVLVHNHPSGISEPSTADLNVTNQIVSAGKILGIEVNDHLIVTSEGWFSFKGNNLL